MKQVTNVCLALALAGGALLNPGAFAALPAASAVRPLPQSNESVSVFWEKFKAAVIKGDKGTVAALSRFPISRGYGMRSLKNKAQFMKHYRELFFAETKAAQCFPKAKAFVEKERPGEFSISCPFASGGGAEEPFVYTFTLTRNGWRFTSFENINE